MADRVGRLRAWGKTTGYERCGCFEHGWLVVPAVSHLTAPFAAQLAAMRHRLDVHSLQLEFRELDEVVRTLDSFETAATVYALAPGFWSIASLGFIVVSAKLPVR